MPSSKPASRGDSTCVAALHGGEVDGAAGEPGPVQRRQRVVADQQAADAGRVAEHLVERDGDEVGLPRARRSSRLVGTNAAASSSTSQPRRRAPASTSSSGCFTPEKFDCAGKANRLARAGSASVEQRGQRGVVDAQLGQRQRRVVDRRALGARELADAVDRVVVVDGQQQAAARRERDTTRRRASARPMAFSVKTAVYSPAALKYASTAARARSTTRRSSAELGFAECGLPKTCSPSRSRVLADLRLARRGRRRCSRGRPARCASRRPYSVARRRSSSRVDAYSGNRSPKRSNAVTSARRAPAGVPGPPARVRARRCRARAGSPRLP